MRVRSGKGSKIVKKSEKMQHFVHGIRHGLRASSMAAKHASLLIKARGNRHEPCGDRHFPSKIEDVEVG